MSTFDPMRKNSIAITISREMALDFGLVEPTPEEASARAASLERYREQKRIRDHAEVAMLTELATKTDAPTVAVLALHRPERHTHGDPTCTECMYGGDMGDHADWPCETVYAVAKAHGIATPEGI